MQERREGACRVVSGIHRDADGFHPSRRQKREKERKSGKRKRRDERSRSANEREGERERSSADATAAVAVAAAAAVAACACTRFFLRPSLLSITSPLPLPSRGARTRSYGRPIAMLPLSLDEECEYIRVYISACGCVRVLWMCCVYLYVQALV